MKAIRQLRNSSIFCVVVPLGMCLTFARLKFPRRTARMVGTRTREA
jgi:hypothetical protein